LLKKGADGSEQFVEGIATANAEFESKKAAIKAKVFS
jgi:hypothetical protein